MTTTYPFSISVIKVLHPSGMGSISTILSHSYEKIGSGQVQDSEAHPRRERRKMKEGKIKKRKEEDKIKKRKGEE